jgi:branched-chain amino acid transport system substrate-binding protein
VLQAWQNTVNAQGGINGHPVKLIFADDQNTPSLGLADVKKLVHEGVVAFVGVQTNTASEWADYVQQNKIPVIGGGPPVPPFGVNTDFYPAGTTAGSSFPLELQASKAVGGTKIGVLYCAEAAACAEAIPPIKAGAAKLHESVVHTAAVSATAPNYVAPCLALKDAGATGVILAVDNGTLARIVKDCASQGYHPHWLGSAATIQPFWATDPNFAGSAGVIDEFPWWESTMPQVAAFTAAMHKYDPGAFPNISVAAETWAAAQLFEAAAKSAGSSITGTSLIAALNGMTKQTLGGVSPPLTFANNNRSITCAHLFSTSGGKFQLQQGGALVCSSP